MAKNKQEISLTEQTNFYRGPGKGKFPSPFSERLMNIFEPAISEQIAAEAMEVIRKRKVLDFILQAGRVSAKVADREGKLQHVEIDFQQLSDDKWQKIFSELASQSYFLAMMLCGSLPLDLEEIVRNQGAELVPTSIGELKIRVDGRISSSITVAVAAVLLRIYDKVDSDPFSLLILRGKGRDETFLEIKKRRALLKKDRHFPATANYAQVPYEPAPPLISTTAYFWSAGKQLEEICYSIRADELPASILKRLEPLPLGGLEDQIDYLLEEAYGRIARLAQSYGLNL